MSEEGLQKVLRWEAEYAAAEVVLAAWFGCPVHGASVIHRGDEVLRVAYDIHRGLYATGEPLVIRLAGRAMAYIHQRAEDLEYPYESLDEFVEDGDPCELVTAIQPLAQQDATMITLLHTFQEENAGWETIIDACARALAMLESEPLRTVVATVAQTLLREQQVNGEEVMDLVRNARNR